MKEISLILSFICSSFLVSVPNFAKGSSDYLGSQKCAQCHAQEYKDWTASDHFKSMAEAKQNTVLGNFQNTDVHFHKTKTKFYKKDQHYFVTSLNSKGKLETFPIRYTFGHWPLQQYLVEMKKGHYQALNIAWDSRLTPEGGQRWFHLNPDEKMSIENPFYWTRHFQNWNSRCAECHSTNLSKNYEASRNTFHTQWSEINVSCEACHGPGKKHLDQVRTDGLKKEASGFTKNLPKAGIWRGTGKTKRLLGTEKDKANIQEKTLNTCGGCHSLRTSLHKPEHGKAYHDQYHIHLLETDAYYLDGQIKTEVFEMGSFMQSKMFQAGVTCSNCHNSHTGKLHLQGNTLCLQCHSPDSYQGESHHKHKIGKPGSQCIECHMPSTVYMGVDTRRDHSFKIPRPDLTAKLGIPNACQTCHKDKSLEWIQKALPIKKKNKSLQEDWVTIHHRLNLYDAAAVKALAELIKHGDLSAIQHASLLGALKFLPPTHESLALIAKGLKNSDPLVRRGSVSALHFMPAEITGKLLRDHMTESSRTVRYEMGLVFADIFNELPELDKEKVKKIIDEYRESLEYTQESPPSLGALGNLELSLGNKSKAEAYYLKALEIESHYVPVMINLADFYRSTARDEKGGALLEKAVKSSPESAMAQHAYALFLIRSKKYEQALVHLKKATDLPDTSPRYAYVYILALQSLRGNSIALEELKKQILKWPHHDQLLKLRNDMESKF